MDFLRKHRNICSAVAALMVAVLVVYSFGFFRSYAAAPEVSTLPADIDIEVTYDADTVTFTYNSITHSISRKSRYELLNTDGSSSYPYTLESNISGYYVPASYWFSPSENRLYVFSGTTGYGITSSTDLDDFSYILGYVASSNKATTDIVGNFYTHNNSNGRYNHYMYFVDYNNNYICNSDNICTRNGDSRDRLMCCWCSVHSYINGVYADDYLNDEGDSVWHYLPTDMICIFSNYNISGFYEIDTSKVNTPSYYFNYQYIFYNKDYGYIFVDSADRLREVGYPNGVNNPCFYFKSVCNSYVYTSLDGISWTLKTSLFTLYSDSFELKTSYGLAGNLQLVYTNDSTYGEEPLVTPDYGSITDITDNLKDIVNDKPLSGRLVSLFTDMNVSDLLLRGVIADGFDMWIDSSDNSTHIGPRGSAPHDVSSVETFPSISMYLYNLVNTELNIDTKLFALRTDLHADLKSIFTNITLTNQYLKRLSDNFDNLSFPDYSGKLDNIYNALLFQGSNSSLDSVGKYVQYIYSVSCDIRTRLDTIIDKMPSGSGSVDFDTDSIVTAINDGSDTLHSDLKYIKALLTIDTVNNLFGDDNDSQNIFNFVSKGIASIVSGSIISDALAFSTMTKDGIVYISSYVNKFYDAVPVYSSIVTVGASFFIIDMVLRRKS